MSATIATAAKNETNKAGEAATTPSIKLDTIKAPSNVKIHTPTKKAIPVIQYTSAISVERSMKDDDSSLVKHARPHYVSEFKIGMQKTARATLEMCRVVHEAKRMLDAYDFNKFCEEVGFRESSATIRKFLAIGKVYPRLIQHADQLPHTWTNIYLITQIPADAFDDCLKMGHALKDIKGKTLTNMLAKTKDISSIEAKLPYDKNLKSYMLAKVFVTKRMDDVDMRAIQKALNELEARLPIKFVLPSEVIKIVDERKLQRYQASKKHYKGIELKPEVWDLGDEANSMLPRGEDQIVVTDQA
jgi:hypothetical protein